MTGGSPRMEQFDRAMVGAGRAGAVLAKRELMPGAVIFDLDGVLMDSEQLWNEAKQALVREAGGRWRQEAPVVMMGMSFAGVVGVLHDDLGVPMDVEAINLDVVRRMKEGYRRELPLLQGQTRRFEPLPPTGRWDSRPPRTARSSTCRSSSRGSSSSFA